MEISIQVKVKAGFVQDLGKGSKCLGKGSGRVWVGFRQGLRKGLGKALEAFRQGFRQVFEEDLIGA